MKKSAKALIVALVFTAIGFAQTTPQLGGWSVSKATIGHHGKQVVMLQVTSQVEFMDGESARPAKLDVICMNGKVSAIALEPAAAIRKMAISFIGTLPTTRVGVNVKSQTTEFESWAVTDGGRTLTPYSEAFQAQQNTRWIERIESTDRMSFAVQTTEYVAQPTFATGQLADALSSVGCSY
jgi:hypothetical protein